MLRGFFSLYRRICAPPELNIKICNLITSYFVIASFILHLNLRYFKRIRKLAALTFGSDIIFRQIFRCAQQLVQISRHISDCK